MSANDDKPLNKSQFVRSFPETVPAADVVKAATEKGIPLSRLYVNSVRFEMRKKATKAGPSVAPPAPAPAHASTPAPRSEPAPASTSSSGREDLLRAAIERMVEQKVEELLRRRVGDIMGG